ncbi:MAG: YkgJ family cysteine cluster protein [Desulfosarcina sp.]
MEPEIDPGPCRRCGTCCEKGGPALHRDDRPLVDQGHIPAGCLFTIRKGERVIDNVNGVPEFLAEEILKIKGQNGLWCCFFYDRPSRGCRIYDHRPVECRALNCRDTRRIEAIYRTARLTRRDLLGGISGLWELIADHEQRCGYQVLQALVGEGLDPSRLKQEKEILEIVRFDAHIRELTVERAGLDGRLLEFIFGRPLIDTIKTFGIQLVKTKGVYGLTAARPPYGKQHAGLSGNARGEN